MVQTEACSSICARSTVLNFLGMQADGPCLTLVMGFNGLLENLDEESQCLGCYSILKMAKDRVVTVYIAPQRLAALTI
jgi:hypothetical protein